MRLNQVTAAAADLDASIAFYRLLGLKLIVRSPEYARFELPRGEATFSLHVTQAEIPREHAPKLYFEVSSVELDALVGRLKQAGIDFDSEPVMQRWLWREAWLRDPAGNRLCLYHAGDNRRFPPWRLGGETSAVNLHLVIRDGGKWAIVKLDGGAGAWRTLQQRFGDYTTSLGPYDLDALLALLEFEWLELFLAHEDKIRVFAESEENELEF